MQPALRQLCACLRVRVIRQSDFSFKWNDKQLSHSWWLTLIPLICVSLRDRLGRRLSMMKAQQETSSMTMRTSTRVPALAVSVFVFVCVCTPWFFKTWQLLGFNLLTLKTYPPPPFPGVVVALLTHQTHVRKGHTHTIPHYKSTIWLEKTGFNRDLLKTTSLNTDTIAYKQQTELDSLRSYLL